MFSLRTCITVYVSSSLAAITLKVALVFESLRSILVWHEITDRAWIQGLVSKGVAMLYDLNNSSFSSVYV